MQTIEDYPNLPDHLTEDEINDIFDHHGWMVEVHRSSSADFATELDVPVQHDVEDWLHMSSRGHPLFIGSPYGSTFQH